MKKKVRRSQNKGNECKLISVAVGRILPNPAYMRKNISDAGLVRLSDSIMRYGIIQPLTVRALPDNGNRQKRNQSVVYELIAGERRLRAAKMAGLAEVPCVVMNADDRRLAEISLTENIVRDGLGFFEEASAMAALIDVFGLTQEETAGVFGVSKGTVSAKLRLLKLTQTEKMLITSNGLSERHARVLLKICDTEKRIEVLRETARLRLSISQTEELVDKVLCPTEEAPPKKRLVTIKDTRLIYNTIDKAIDSIERTGISIEKERKESDESVEFVFRIKKPQSTEQPQNSEMATVIETPRAVG